MGPRGPNPRLCRRIQLVPDLRQRIPKPVLSRRIQRQPAIPIRMRIVVGTHPGRAFRRRPPLPIRRQSIAKQHLACRIAQPRLTPRGGFPNPQIVPHVQAGVRLAPEVLPREQRVRLIHAGINRVRYFHLRRHPVVPRHVTPHQTRGFIGQSVWKPRTRRQQQQVRRPCVARCQHEPPSAILHFRAIVQPYAGSRSHPRRRFLQNKLSH